MQNVLFLNTYSSGFYITVQQFKSTAIKVIVTNRVTFKEKCVMFQHNTIVSK